MNNKRARQLRKLAKNEATEDSKLMIKKRIIGKNEDGTPITRGSMGLCYHPNSARGIYKRLKKAYTKKTLISL